MFKIGDLMFDDSRWDIKNPENIIGLTAIMYDAVVEDENHNMIVCGKTEINQFLDKELAEACEIDLDTLEGEIYA
ncbi:MAG: hypothetical protein J6J36_08070 [Clostridia bacterium]|nr:hypothetical protein [Clostridia bacterium]MBP3708529.1 hypothetical protein [Clostridia bacterium]